MRFGYARVSKGKYQDPAPQVAALKEAGCDRVYIDQMTGARWDRPELTRLMDQLRPGDVLVVWKLDRLGRSLKDLLVLLEKVEARGAGFRSSRKRSTRRLRQAGCLLRCWERLLSSKGK